MEVTVLTINFNTPELLDACLRSVRKCMGEKQRVVVVENSTERPYRNTFPNVEVIDNTKGKMVNFEKRLAYYPDKWLNRTANNWASARHTMTIDAMMDVLTDGFIVIDSDVLLKRDLKPIADRYKACVSEIQTQKERKGSVKRFCPYCQWVNVPMLKEHGIRYFNGNYMWLLTRTFPNCWYDTGAWLYKAVNDKCLPYTRIDFNDYIVHYDHGSHPVYGVNASEWLETNRTLYE